MRTNLGCGQAGGAACAPIWCVRLSGVTVFYPGRMQRLAAVGLAE
ncbi:hypothetical protein [Pseudomonas sp. LP_7_YM]|nr:hypothetical protein [Pseudomonas sp. LP_7_YM]